MLVMFSETLRLRLMVFQYLLSETTFREDFTTERGPLAAPEDRPPLLIEHLLSAGTGVRAGHG